MIYIIFYKGYKDYFLDVKFLYAAQEFEVKCFVILTY